jgi:hypothetical protein
VVIVPNAQPVALAWGLITATSGFSHPGPVAVVGVDEAGTWQNKKIHVILGQRVDHQHILGTNLVKQVNKSELKNKLIIDLMVKVL